MYQLTMHIKGCSEPLTLVFKTRKTLDNFTDQFREAKAGFGNLVLQDDTSHTFIVSRDADVICMCITDLEEDFKVGSEIAFMKHNETVKLQRRVGAKPQVIQ